jgi:hypothetical protein
VMKIIVRQVGNAMTLVLSESGVGSRESARTLCRSPAAQCWRGRNLSRLSCWI